MTPGTRWWLPVCAGLLLCLSARATPAPGPGGALWMPQVFGDHMVLPCDEPAVLWGRAEPGDSVTVLLDGQQLVRGLADPTGAWSVTLPPQGPGAPHRLEVRAGPADQPAREQRSFDDVAFGQVWLVAGGANVAWPLERTPGAARLMQTGEIPSLRLLPIAARSAQRARDDVDATWIPSHPETAREASALAWFFGRALQLQLDVPVGIIIVSRTLTPIEPWIAEQGYLAVPGARTVQARLQRDVADYERDLGAVLDDLDAWLARARTALESDAPLPSAPDVPRHPLTDPRSPTALFLGSIAPLASLPLAGVVWYQGEQDLGDGPRYAFLLEALVRGWRDAFGQPGLPFVVLQLPPYDDGDHRAGGPSVRAPDPQRLPRLWAAQQTVLQLPHTSLGLVHDVVDPADFFPPDKRVFGERLARLALADVYGRDVAAHGPEYADHQRRGAALRVRFDHAAGLTTRDGAPPDHFELCGADGVWHPAEARLDGDAVLLTAPAVPEPAQVRLGWHQTASPNLINAAGLPVRAFSTTP